MLVASCGQERPEDEDPSAAADSGSSGGSDSSSGGISYDTSAAADSGATPMDTGASSSSGGVDSGGSSSGTSDTAATSSGSSGASGGSSSGNGFSSGGGLAEAKKLSGWCNKQHKDFSFFVTSMAALWKFSGHDVSDMSGGFGGDFGGVAGADQVCQAIAAATGHGDKTWRAAICATKGGPGGGPVNAGDRIGKGPWHDANGRLIAKDLAGLVDKERPEGDAKAIDDLPDECGVPISVLGDAHDVVTGCNKQMKLNANDLNTTCNDWTSSDGKVGSTGGPKGQGAVMCGHSFPRQAPGGGGKPPGGGPPGGGKGGKEWFSDHPVRGCGKGANLIQNGPGVGTCIGCSGGYGALYCFAVK